MPEFQEGFDAYQKRGAFRDDPYDGVKAQAWDRGANAAMLYARALAHLARRPQRGRREGRPRLARPAPPDGEVLTSARGRKSARCALLSSNQSWIAR
jgi:hypothetical protein